MEDGGIETVGMGGVDAELVGAAGKRKEIDQNSAIRAIFPYFITRNGRFAVLEVHHLSRTVVGIGQEGKVNQTF